MTKMATRESRARIKSIEPLGVIKALDRIGRVVIPAEFRARLGLRGGEDKVEVFLTRDGLLMRKYEASGGKGDVGGTDQGQNL